MKRMMFACAAMAALQVAAITATKEYVDRKDAEIRTNTYTRAETDARIAELSPRTSLSPATNYTDYVASRIAKDATNYTDISSAIALHKANDYTTNKVSSLKSELKREISSVPVMTTNDVKNIVTNETVYSFDQWRFFIGSEEQSSNSFSIEEQYAQEEYAYFLYYMGEYISMKSFATEQSTIGWTGLGFGNLYSTRTSKTKNALGLARLSDLPTNHVTKAELEAAINNIDIPQIDTSNFATKGELEDVEDAQEGFLRDLVTSSNRVDNLAGSVNVLWSHVYGNSVWIAVTNYLRTIEGVVPSFQLWEVRDGVTNCVYSSAEEITNLTAKLIKDGVAEATNGMPTKAWSKYQSGTGAENPQPGAVTIVSTPNVMLTGGGEWYKCIETGDAAVWVLKSNGLCTLGGDTNGYFRIVDDEGKAQFEIVKTASFEVDAIASDTAFDASDNFTVTYNANMANPPTLYAAASLDDPFEGEDASHNINSLGISVSWAKNGSGYWVATIHQDSRLPRLFVHAKMLQEGQNAIRNVAPMLLDGGLIIGGVKYNIVPYTTGGKTYLTLEAQ